MPGNNFRFTATYIRHYCKPGSLEVDTGSPTARAIWQSTLKPD